MLKVLSDAYVAANTAMLLGLLDHSAGFDTVDHIILIDCLRCTFSVVRRLLDWVISYTSGSTQFMLFNRATSTVKSVSYSVPQGSIRPLCG